MGASESNCKPEIDPRSWIANNKTVGVADSRHYGDRAKIVLEKATGRKIIVKEKFIDNQAFNDRISEYLRSGALHCGVFTTLRANMVGTQKQYCGTCISARKLVMAFEYHDRNLAKEIAWRSQRNDPFPEPEIFFVLKKIVTMERIIQKMMKGSYHGNLSLDSIYLTEEGEVKFLDPFLLESIHTPYEKHMLGLVKFPLSPELIHCLQSHHPKPNCDKKKVEVWTIGILMLSLMNLVQPDYFYDWRNDSLKYNELDQMLGNVVRRYSPLLVRAISKCLELSPVNRCSMRDLEQTLKYYYES